MCQLPISEKSRNVPVKGHASELLFTHVHTSLFHSQNITHLCLAFASSKGALNARSII